MITEIKLVSVERKGSKMSAVQVIEIEEGKDILFTIGGKVVAMVEVEPTRESYVGNQMVMETYKQYQFVAHAVSIGQTFGRKFVSRFPNGGSVNFDYDDAEYAKSVLEHRVFHGEI